MTNVEIDFIFRNPRRNQFTMNNNVGVIPVAVTTEFLVKNQERGLLLVLQSGFLSSRSMVRITCNVQQTIWRYNPHEGFKAQQNVWRRTLGFIEFIIFKHAIFTLSCGLVSICYSLQHWQVNPPLSHSKF